MVGRFSLSALDFGLWTLDFGNSLRTRSCISRAALLVNVTPRMCAGEIPRATMCAMRKVMTRVLPVPAPARMSTGPLTVSAAWRCCGLSVFKFNMGAKFSLPRSEGKRAAGNFRKTRIPLIASSSAGSEPIRGAVETPRGAISPFSCSIKSSSAAFGFASGAIRLMSGVFGLTGGGIRPVSGAISSTSGAVGLTSGAIGLTGGAIRLAGGAFVTLEFPAFCMELAFGSGKLPVPGGNSGGASFLANWSWKMPQSVRWAWQRQWKEWQKMESHVLRNFSLFSPEAKKSTEGKIMDDYSFARYDKFGRVRD